MNDLRRVKMVSALGLLLLDMLLLLLLSLCVPALLFCAVLIIMQVERDRLNEGLEDEAWGRLRRGAVSLSVDVMIIASLAPVCECQRVMELLGGIDRKRKP